MCVYNKVSKPIKILLSSSYQNVLPAASCIHCGAAFNHVTSFSSTNIWHHQQRQQHTGSTEFLKDMSSWQRIKWNMGFSGTLRVPKRRLMMSGLNLYVCCTDFLDFKDYVEAFSIPDTFTSWFLLLQLHLWMVNVKVTQLGKEGFILKESMYRAMWIDVEKRLNTFKDLTGGEKRKAMDDYYSFMIASILYYDKGIMGSDKVLANSLWIQLYGQDPGVKFDKLQLVVDYVRKQVYHHDHLDPQPILHPGHIPFLPVVGDKLDESKSLKNYQMLLSV
ncbi:ubiquinol-cytochrome-c reductase complex assembly factor 1-like isoform X2 [Physella acuta]|uniref:ubiquinol-cytochrome-c reductase complex assembly factor 1-like isoform X2 n=1 Tax=Physella acuta TaxID=109671 RepID=UPI0027DE8281|nr:ubiquinol-cytochrome-c reductase complex assembly factor 1-like isoform X2 [Physella acuta]